MPSQANRRRALITGASSGIGECLAEVFASEGFDLVLVARREERLAVIAERCQRAYGIEALALPCDLSDPAAADYLFEETARRGLLIDALVNNAGYGVPGSFRSRPWSEHAAFLQVLLTSLVHLTHRFEGGMTERGYGRILNVASLAGLVPPSARHTLYAPAKAFVVRFSEALALEHLSDGIHVTALCPGYTYSEFHDRLGNRTQVAKLPGPLWMSSQQVARAGFDAVMRGDVVHVPGRLNQFLAGLVQALPEGASRRLMRRSWKLVRSDG
jgi:short-subunit dehydrogenase